LLLREADGVTGGRLTVKSSAMVTSSTGMDQSGCLARTLLGAKAETHRRGFCVVPPFHSSSQNNVKQGEDKERRSYAIFRSHAFLSFTLSVFLVRVLEENVLVALPRV
jgi:hypothetical protein